MQAQQQQLQTVVTSTMPPKTVALLRTSPPQSQFVADNSQLDIELALTATKVQINRNDNDDGIDQMRSNSQSSNSTDSTSVIVGVAGAKKSTKNNSKTFVRPTSKGATGEAAKVALSSSSSSSSSMQSTTLPTATNRSKTTGKSQSSVRTKRSYSQSSHHEALQRISSSSRMSNSCASSMYGGRFMMAAIPIVNEWHAPESYVYDYAGPSIKVATRADLVDLLPCTQNVWFQTRPTIIAAQPITREQRLDIKKVQLRRQAHQFAEAQHFRGTGVARRRLVAVARALKKLKEDNSSTT